MNVFPRSRALNAFRASWIPVAMLLFLLPTLLPAQDVPYTGNGIMTVTGSAPIYNGPYVLQQSDYGFFWLDTSTLRPGHVQAVSKCVSSLPPSDSGIYILGDCNSITSISSSGNTVLVRLFGSQCGAQTRGCGGPRDNGHARFSFALGTWQYLGDGTEIPDSTQKTDPQGRTWTVQPTDATQRNFLWHATGGTPPSPSSTPTPAFTPTPTPTPTPGPAVKATNLSSQDRGDPVPTNYYGDKWQLQDISNPNPTRTDWDFNYQGTFVPDEGGSPASEGSVTGYFPCDPSGPVHGDIRTGGSCMQSLGLTNPPAPRNYQFAMLSSVSASPYVPPALQVSCPQVGIVGYAGFTGTCSETGGILTVARGGAADARISKGNTTDPATSFDWTFPGSSTPNVSGPAPGVPSDATTFALTITFPGGYQATAAGTVVIVTSTPVLGIFTDSAATVSPFFGGGAFQLTAGRTYYLKDTESTAPASAHFFFNNGAGDVELPGSPTAGPGPLSWIPTAACPSHCSVKVSVGSISNSVPVAISLAVGPTPVPTPVPTATPPAGGSVTVSVAGPTSGSRATPLNFTASVSGGAGGYRYAWTCQYNALGGSSQFVAGSQTTTCTYASVGAYVVMAKVTDAAGATGYSAGNAVTITGLPSPSGAYTVSGATPNPFAARYEAPAGTPITFTATEASATYSWNFGDGTSEQTTKSVTHTFGTSGSYSAILTVTGDGVTTSGTVSTTINLFITPPSFRAAIVPGAAHLDDGTTTWGTDVSITNGGTTSMSIGLAFVPLVPESAAPATLDLTQLNYGTPVELSSGASYSVSDVVAALKGGNNKGTVVIKYEPGTRAPLLSARLYFQPKDNPGNVSYGSGIPSYEVDGSGRISPQGFVSTALSGSPLGLGTESQAAVLDMALTVSLTGSGSGTVTSNPAGINCPTTCTASFPDGTYVTLNGSPAAGSAFVGITGCDSYSVGQCTMSMNSSKNVTARFDGSGPAPTPTPGPTNFTLSVTRAGTGSGTVSSAPSGISCGATCGATFAKGTAVTLTAAPDSGSTFSGWGRACSGTGSCSLTLSANQSATATFTAASAVPPPSDMNPRTGKRRPISNVTRSLGDQFLIGLRSDPRYQFVVTLFNAGVTQGNFELRATDDQGAPVVILDASGSPVAFRRFNNLGPYQQVDLRDSDLGLDDGKHYVLKATTTKGTLLAFGTTLDRKTLDLEQISDDGQASPAEDGIVSYWVAGVSRSDTSGAHWRTDLRIFNRGSKARNLSFQYSYISDGVEHVAEVANPIAAGQLLTYDDVVAALLARDKRVDLSGSNAGILRIFYPEDDESPTRPLIIGSRNYDDDPAGTVGSQLAVYTSAQAGSPSHDLFLTGVEDSARYASRIGVFAMDPGRVTGRIVVVAPDGSQVGSKTFGLGGSDPRFGQISLTDSDVNFKNPGKPVSIRFDQLSGGRVGAYAFTADKVTLDTNFIQALPQN